MELRLVNSLKVFYEKTILFTSFFLLIVFLNYSLTFSASPTNKAKISQDKNLHKSDNKLFQNICHNCHSNDPLKTTQGADTIQVENCESYCRECHKIPESCRLISSANATLILKSQLQYIALPLFSDRISCGSCHFFHEYERQPVGENRLNSFYPNFWYRVQQIDPHKSGVFCQLCHESSFNLSASNLKLKFQADRVSLCIQCHDGKKARSDNHPVRVSPSEEKGVKVPDGFPLSDGKVSCLTCHKMPCQGGEIEKKLLRGGPYEKRVDACLVCHSKERYQAVNPHIQIDENGKIMKNKCLYCHII